jgi:hypothetical protein
MEPPAVHGISSCPTHRIGIDTQLLNRFRAIAAGFRHDAYATLNDEVAAGGIPLTQQPKESAT